MNKDIENLLGDIGPLLPFFETKTITNVFVYGDGRVQADDFEQSVYETGLRLTPELQCRSPNKTQLYIRKEQAVAAIKTIG